MFSKSQLLCFADQNSTLASRKKSDHTTVAYQGPHLHTAVSKAVYKLVKQAQKSDFCRIPIDGHWRNCTTANRREKASTVTFFFQAIKSWFRIGLSWFVGGMTNTGSLKPPRKKAYNLAFHRKKLKNSKRLGMTPALKVFFPDVLPEIPVFSCI